MRKKKVSITDVARSSAVSVSTVSYVMNGKRSISEETKKRVIDAAKSLGYVPKNHARALELGLGEARYHRDTKVLALSSPVRPYTDYTNYAVFFFALAQRARRYGYDILLLMHESGDEELFRVVNNHMVDGILLLDVLLADSRADIAKNLPVPVVAVGYPNNTEHIWSTDIDFEKAGRDAIDKAHVFGHRTVAIVGGLNDAFDDGSNYLVRFRDAAIKHGSDLGISVVCRTVQESSMEEIEKGLGDLLDSQARPTLIIWQGSTVGAGMLEEALYKRGLKVPQDLSLMAACTFGVSRIPHPMNEYPLDATVTAKSGVDMMIEILEGKRDDVGAVELLPSKYVNVGTLGPAPQG
ncbi:LacI family DNA-binding transcriptional regulator [Alloscardovia criceti]|uniref:LacI family DNA-binding transcriptional regulator n=1 Tax=Alloscardovia criceti TaxID=356828 RepID=UPI000371E55F|nr:LacI family DNA-binding transcriptional regulator [Alloscardovia criceti]